MIQRFIPPPGRFDIDAEVSLRLLLACIIRQRLRPQTPLAGITGVRLVVIRGASISCEKSMLMAAPSLFHHGLQSLLNNILHRQIFHVDPLHGGVDITLIVAQHL